MTEKNIPSIQDHVPGQSNKPLSQPPHAIEFSEVLAELHVDPITGLGELEAQSRLAEYGPNELEMKKGVQPFKILMEQVLNAMTLILVLALAASFGIQAWIPGGILGAIIIFNIGIGFFQSLQAKRTIDSLRNLGAPTCREVRDSKTITIQTFEVVPGDVINIGMGDAIPADIRLIEAVNCSTVFTKDRGRGVVFATGMFTEIGSIAGALNGNAGNKAATGSRLSRLWHTAVAAVGEFLGLTVGTPLQKKLSGLFLWLFAFAIICVIIVLGVNKFSSRHDVIIYAVTTAVGTIPVSLLLVLTVTIAAGTKKMLERHVIVRNLQSLEALGGVTDICSDKTGTITQGRMVVRKAWLPSHGTYIIAECPFDSDVKKMSVICQHLASGDMHVLTKSPRRVCSHVMVHMLTGDYPHTARAIAAEVGILPTEDKLRMLARDTVQTIVMAAHEFDNMTDAQVNELSELPLVLARCAPSTKVRMIKALHRRGRYVAMTGDGVNDSPSLRYADIGITMGS
ncbi:hypothetical protein Sste5346_008021 [Sporothrix stenoceras]|uniref:Cation-transporting P-type ATPase N-terminal domain-containing protein n=1 Tax=Sporothrix stenoceras TaxID=5173 RepID=A0ABR3YSP4_9PEZI